MFRKVRRPDEKPKLLREMLEEALEKALPSLRCDIQLREFAIALEKRRIFSEEGQTEIMHEIDALLERILVDSLRRRGLRWMSVSVSSHVSHGAVKAVIITKALGREARRYLEVNLQ